MNRFAAASRGEREEEMRVKKELTFQLAKASSRCLALDFDILLITCYRRTVNLNYHKRVKVSDRFYDLGWYKWRNAEY